MGRHWVCVERRETIVGTKIRPEISQKNKYWIDKHRYYELKHFCLQYSSWKNVYRSLEEEGIYSTIFYDFLPKSKDVSNPTEKYALTKAYYSERINMIERIAYEADEQIGGYILKAVTEDLSYTYLKTKLQIPCGKDMYYDRYRRFFWLLSETRR